MNVEWGPLAAADLVRIVRYIAEENPIAARRIGRELLIAADSLQLFPYRGRPGRAPGTRELVAVRPYVLAYEITGATIAILRVWHAAQDRP